MKNDRVFIFMLINVHLHSPIFFFLFEIFPPEKVKKSKEDKVKGGKDIGGWRDGGFFAHKRASDF